MQRRWERPAERIFQPSYPDGRTRFTIDRDADGYRLWFESFGHHLVSADGATICCARGEVTGARRERFVFAQALPLAAALRGFELLHAGAVARAGRVTALVGPSGAGKTSLASRLVANGWRFVTDDVLALELTGGAPIAHPGPPFMAVPAGDRSIVAEATALGALRGASDKLHACPAPIDGPLPLETILYIESGAELELAPLEGDAARLLGAAFAPYLITPERLHRHLEVAGALSRGVRQLRLQIPRTRRFDDVLDAINGLAG